MLVAAACLGVVAGAMLQAATGFGFSLLAAPLLFAAIDPEPAVVLLLVLGLEVNVLTLAGERRRPRPLPRTTALLLAWATPGALAGVAVLRALPPGALQVAVTLGVVGTLAARRVTTAHVPAWAAGLAAGALTTTTSTNGPPLLLHLLGRGVTPTQVRDTLTVCFVGLAGLGALALFGTGDPALPDAGLTLGLLPAVAAGHLVGRRAFRRLSESGRYELVLTVALVAAVGVGLIGALV
ncbi:TSUP family transporter [Solirubrobacter ginsenosidimutans]|uniref:Probable membrane transporter protein n=1 Tax=Solirubrobacter ginsenosidimutans TaxID=490573 RepID=A0A9X3MYJ8_9ACTN|nr:TSUP family transporter [Solirubrobacter ginsenosidimutans]MDA0165139.1 TSUP family transporter [Solirubrobacter ginsenosidimutans]